MISVLISSESRYRIDRQKIKKGIEDFLGQVGMNEVEVSVAVVGGRKIRSLNKTYRQLDESTDVLSFPQEGSRDPDGILRLGDILVCYPQAIEQAVEEDKMVDEKINELVEHGLRHLLGIHHPE
ncbi:rRNA maturation RNase YbeY [Candidatus Shapirobacteria bacterium CG08_land_8_20_14_0_20_39_18]|uniref:rRNA maturation RNase YbeY n=1 Tax=Candidatus Shapirobacteria bacterium CG08_land_8_20_14_0_20_39_18 TaxID=1974883 RepID=A0A2M6XCA5_9BACT|nr:MAG: rRNA maturation RNase YbeY [Candidatus Shapirobacteria bacterium CG08_land_8_20_14_0_20_39_18]PIY66057.1 MAG: rRNA maturation RNase YbeY [Candidatus Shapirobacteria bacterium CG_4_10_14_0_8_um_filter_39_15]PJE68259.1 MAG: rRNA maturation RNase YbeY [Candidatus Shapirobacteria bacterium CG10_big_fil_rev_8_21_14_0_10_38_8]